MYRLTLVAVLLMGCDQAADDTDADTSADTGADTEQDSDDGTDQGTEGECLEDLDPEYGTDDCLTFNGANDVCGGAEGEMCAFLVGCGYWEQAGQCTIDCTMSTTIACVTQADAACLTDAFCADDCAAVASCSWLAFETANP